MDWKLEGSARETESEVLQEQEAILEDTGEDGLSDSFRLLQIDVECEHQEGETLPTGAAVWCSVSAASGHGSEMMGCPRDPYSETGNKKTGNDFGLFQGLYILLTGVSLQFHLSHRESKYSSIGIFDIPQKGQEI